MEEYIKIPSIFQKIKSAETYFKPIYICGMTGFGKSAAVEYYLRRRPYLYLSGMGGSLSSMPKPEEIRESVVVVDDLSWIYDEKSKQYIKSLLHQKNMWVILIGRAQLPEWLRIEDIELGFVRASEKDLLFSQKEVFELYEAHGISLSNELCAQITEVSGGYAIFLILMLKRMESGEEYSEILIEETREDMFQYSDHAFYQYWSDDLKQVLLAVCEYDTFTAQMISELTQMSNISDILLYSSSIGNFLQKCGDGEYRINQFLRRYLNWKKSFVYSKEDYFLNYHRAAYYYECKDEVENAAKYYKKAKEEDNVRRLLINNAKLTVGRGHYFELREYYLELSEEEVNQSILLITALSLLCSILLRVEDSEKWYQRLVEYYEREDISKQEKLEARVRIAYLNVSLPHRGSKHMLETVKDMALIVSKNEYILPDLSLTSNLPSMINGGMDFSEWCKKDKELELVIAKPIEVFLGEQGRGLVPIAWAESGFEKNTIQELDLVRKVNQGLIKTEAGGRIEIEFVGNALLAKNFIVHGKMDLARKQMDAFRNKVYRVNAKQLYANLEAMYIWMSLIEGNTTYAKIWLENSVNESEEFTILKRYQYIMKVRMLIAFSRYTEALHLIERLDYYFTVYERKMYWIENQILKAGIYYRLNYKEWSQTIALAIEKASEYGFIRCVEMEGAFIKPLFDEDLEIKGVKPQYIKTLQNSINQMAKFYPDYLKAAEPETQRLTEKEQEILQLMISGATSQEICEQCGITYNSLKFHNKNIYKKLGVKSRQEAERKAINLKLV